MTRRAASIRRLLGAVFAGLVAGALSGAISPSLTAPVFMAVAVLAWLGGVTTRENPLYCPHCRRRTKIGAQACRHCGRVAA